MAIAEDGATSAVLELPEVLDFSACDVLSEELDRMRGCQIIVDASKVQFIGGLAAEILARARVEWVSEDAGFKVENPSKEMLEGLDLLGIQFDEASDKKSQ